MQCAKHKIILDLKKVTKYNQKLLIFKIFNWFILLSLFLQQQAVSLSFIFFFIFLFLIILIFLILTLRERSSLIYFMQPYLVIQILSYNILTEFKWYVPSFWLFVSLVIPASSSFELFWPIIYYQLIKTVKPRLMFFRET